jgi:nucleotide-binding universal stress UspA family protein
VVATVVSGHRKHDHRTGHIDDELVDHEPSALESVETRLRQSGVAFECRRLEGTSAARALHEAAEETGAALLVVGASRRSAAGRVVLLGGGVIFVLTLPVA